MRYFRYLFTFAIMFSLGACASMDCKRPTREVPPGSDKATVAIYLDKNGFPKADAEKVIVAPGQKIVFVGPDQFDIIFKDNRSPIDKPEVRTSNGILVLEISKNIFEKEDRKNPENKKNNEMIYRYGIRVNGKVTDPEIVVRPR